RRDEQLGGRHGDYPGELRHGELFDGRNGERPGGPRGERTAAGAPRAAGTRLEFAELRAASSYHFLHGASEPEELVEQAIALGLSRSEEHTSELQSRFDLVCRLLLEKKK